MNGSFGLASVRLSGMASRLLGWRPHDFWAATPAELTAALTSPADTTATRLDRTDLNRLMERDNG